MAGRGRWWTAALIGGFLATGASAAPSPAPEPVTAYVHADLIDGTGAPVRRDMAVVVRGERIVAVEPSAKALSDHPGATIVDMHGRFVLPGLINSHEHIATPPNRTFALGMMRRDLYGGVTAMRDMADDLRSVAEIAREARLGEIPSPDIYFAALMAGPEFFEDPRTIAAAAGETPGKVPWMQAIDARTDMRTAVTLARGTGATAIKAYADMPAADVAAIVAEAHRQGVPVWAHAMVFPAAPQEVIDAGTDVVSHVCMLAYQASPVRPRAYHKRAPVEEARFPAGRDNLVVQGLLDDMKRRGTILDATNYVYEALARDKAAHPERPAPYCTPGLAERLTNQAYRTGVMISAGTDSFAAKADPWPALQGELELLVEKAGMTPLDAILSATLVGARAAAQEKDMGSLQVGKLANLVFVSADPSHDIRALRTVVLTVKRGKPYWRKDYRPLTAAETEGEL